ncbi:hypothetical protein FVE85_1584 [Porphyridium purpureum]|uniref:Uncharacterized protein n=1 Tax=Porphyridium purpureum TaxID=35688 RepID=A0A5J4YV97_PORPP|nr:hypothetical protein FVE85_1584 [Porphyridium purpureum]|eukprot:POR5274..scf209_3
MASLMSRMGRVVARRVPNVRRASGESLGEVDAKRKVLPWVERDGMKIPEGNDPGIYHDETFMDSQVTLWRRASLVCLPFVFLFGIYTLSGGHPHHEPTPNYDYMKVRLKVPRYPWGDRELIGTPSDRERWKKEDAGEIDPLWK